WSKDRNALAVGADGHYLAHGEAESGKGEQAEAEARDKADEHGADCTNGDAVTDRARQLDRLEHQLESLHLRTAGAARTYRRHDHASRADRRVAAAAAQH